MPKVELHLHLEGAFIFETLFRLMQKYGAEDRIKSIGDLQTRFEYRDFGHFIDTWLWKNQFFRESEDFEEMAFTAIESLHRQNVIYVEMFFSPFDFLENGISVKEVTEATLSGIRRAERRFGIRCGLIADLVRDYGGESALERLDQVSDYKSQGIIGIGLGGTERDYPPELFEDVFLVAKERGFHLVAHAGEVCGPESVWTAVNVLGAERIGHGVQAIDDPKLVRFLERRKIPLEVCITSNIKTGIFPGFQDHPIAALIENGLLVTINSDDPTMFGTTITDEFLLLHDRLSFGLPSIKKLTQNAIEASFLDEMEKETLQRRVDQFWQENCGDSLA